MRWFARTAFVLAWLTALTIFITLRVEHIAAEAIKPAQGAIEHAQATLDQATATLATLETTLSTAQTTLTATQDDIHRLGHDLSKNTALLVFEVQRTAFTLREQTVRANDSLATTAGAVVALRDDIQPGLRSAGHAAAQVDGALPLFLDCDHNPDCVFNRYVGVAQSTEKTMKSVQATTETISATAPIVAAQIKIATEASRRASENIAEVAANLKEETRPRRLWAVIGGRIVSIALGIAKLLL